LLRVHIDVIIQYTIALGALITAIAALLNIRIMKKNNRNSYLPQIYPTNSYYVMRKTDEELPYIVQQGKSQDDIISYAMNNAPVSIRNIGLGAGVSVEFLWKYDKISLISTLMKTGKSLIIKDEDHDSLYYYLKENEGKFGFEFELPEYYRKSIASIIPGEEISIYIPETILNYIRFRNITNYRNTGNVRDEYSLEDIILEINYKDIGKKSVKQNIKMRINSYTHFRKNATNISDHSIIKIEYY
jgi:hypothetical protein